ncbi:fructosyl amino acid oxidase [Aspergillus costaricaensis CBS 115574]|uniref:Fructosyl amino acid oxidase n=1 Tax=Aspergillus costaricaensis CBS 115574 TaxID=1448317 RepID=A0ACD1I799_9EURO|nr:fructosyl amino acid oxidase [Aspergillus costaricaensis CBS 115574]RAK86388.1 fructosyl amino acid oxidase [Aspergillus costaricaensis CBS 115574]
MSTSLPSEILIIGGGVMGLSTACALVQRPHYANSSITLLDAAAEVLNGQGASVDTSRILRADYAIKSYTRLVSEAREKWQDVSPNGWGGQGRYHEAKLILTAQPGTEGHVDGYLEESLENLKELARSGQYSFKLQDLKELPDRDAVARETLAPGSSGDFGYVNNQCGWVNAEACVKYALEKAQYLGGDRVKVRTNARVKRLLYQTKAKHLGGGIHCTGVELLDGSRMYADLVIVAAGAWTPSLVDVEGRAAATGQVLAYMPISSSEQKALDESPIYFNVSRGMFMLPPHDNEMKMGRHGYGYQNPTKMMIPRPTLDAPNASTETTVSVPRTDLPIPAEAEKACKDFLVEMFPSWKGRSFSKTRVCWYCDTPTGDFLIDYLPHASGLFVATGDSGHGFKVFPIIGEKIADAIEGHLDSELQDLWRWKPNAPSTFQGTDDGTRGGRRGMILEQERRDTGRVTGRL